MAKTIWKTILIADDVQEIKVPAGAELLSVREQGNQLCLWFFCDPHAPETSRKIAVVGTGHPAPDEGRYLGTASFQGGSYIFHAFELPQAHS